jgi:hypothetical protein
MLFTREILHRRGTPEPERVSPDEGVSYWQGGEITYVRTPAWGQRCTGALRSFSTDFYERFLLMGMDAN